MGGSTVLCERRRENPVWWRFEIPEKSWHESGFTGDPKPGCPLRLRKNGLKLKNGGRKKGFRRCLQEHRCRRTRNFKPPDLPHFHSVFFGIYVLANIDETDRKSTRLNSSHANISYAVFCCNK